ncbi:uncharacterized protein SAPINGB_P001143 [Magnusiomyces paraingens]|uniref:Uncharacterized protein n=1 Tax=Magnusiomyces paraingens TaxID=2606893 RepID=A0A5E8B613_9ASCO|nr:uncharacterized protein SAPINGB_P001143 [Saprochaete ingens]VVT46296.1 unnamed protein product [Saprochaete ingens]
MTALRQLTRIARKTTLATRITQSRAFGTSMVRMAKDDNSTIDFFKFPDMTVSTSLPSSHINIPSLPDSWTTLNSLKPVTVGGGSTKPTAEFKAGDISHVSGQATASQMSDTEPLTRGQNDLLSFFESSEAGKDTVQELKLEELGEKDRFTLTVIASGVVAYWLVAELLFNDEAAKHPEDLKELGA